MSSIIGINILKLHKQDKFKYIELKLKEKSYFYKIYYNHGLKEQNKVILNKLNNMMLNYFN